MTYQLGQRVADAVISEFGNLNIRTGKPSNGMYGNQEWTVLAGLVAIQNNQISVISLATGVKSMPDSVRQYSSGRIVHDSHAEMICLRAFNWYLMEEIRGNCERRLLSEISGSEINEHTISTRDEICLSNQNFETVSLPKFQLDPSIELALYTSKLPCGDASMPCVSMGRVSWGYTKYHSFNSNDFASQRQRIVRGRDNAHELGVVRTKMSKPNINVLSKSCSDKLCLRQYTGILNCINSLRVVPVFLDYLVLDEKQYRSDDFSRCFTRRLNEPPLHGLQALTFSRNNYQFERRKGKITSVYSIAYCGFTKTVQVLERRMKVGAYVENRTPKLSDVSLLCRDNLWRQAHGEIPDFDRYSEVKRANPQRQQLKLKARAQLGSWPECQNDDFSI